MWRDWGLVEILREAWLSGVMLAGVSAGAICWFEQGITDSMAGRLSVIGCLGFLEGSYCPHYDTEPVRRQAYHDFLQHDEIRAGYAMDDGVALHFSSKELIRVVAEQSQAKAYYLRWNYNAVEEKPLMVECLE